MTDTWHAAVKPQEPSSAPFTSDLDTWVRLATMERLGASVQELAQEQFESLLGYMPSQGDPALDAILGEPTGGHKPARADIQKYKDVYDFMNRAAEKTTPDGLDDSDLAAQREWDDKYKLTDLEQGYLRAYSTLYREYLSQEAAFNGLASIFDSRNGIQVEQGHEPTPEAKKMAGQLLKKNEEQHWGQLYEAIWKSIFRLKRNYPESYKLWPWFIGQMKARFQSLANVGSLPPVGSRSQVLAFDHGADIVGEAGKVLSELRANNQLPQNFDIAKLNLEELEEWLMQWKRDNRETESKGTVVYEFHNKWTIQKLESPESLQFEGDEMGHCVGGYSHQVESGRTTIYSLRDEKGNPHVTMEIENPHVYKRMSDKPYSQMEPQDFLEMDQRANAEHRGNGVAHEPVPDLANADEAEHWYSLRYENRDLADKLYPGIPHTMMYAQSDADHQDYYQSNGLPWTKEYGVVQVQGKGNKTPKPEYQRMIKEFLDVLREKGLTFERSDNWYGNWDDPYGDDSDNDPSDHDGLMEWYEAYQSDHKSWQTPTEDAYGLPGDRRTISGGYIDDIIENTLYGLSNVYDRSKATLHDWQTPAQAIYHLMNVQYLQERVNTPERKEAEKQNWLSEIEKAQETLDEWSNDMADNNWEYIQEGAQENFKGFAESSGIDLEAYEDEWGNVDWQRVQEEHEEDWMDIQDKVREEESNEIYGDSYKFINYLYHLIEGNGHVGPLGVPDPNQKNGGLKSHQEIQDDLKIKFPGAFSKVRDDWKEGKAKVAASPYQIVPIDETNNIWFDEDGQSHQRYRPAWAKDENGKMKQTGQNEDSFLDKQGRQGQGVVAYHGNTPVGSLTWVEDPSGTNMLGTTFVHPDHREKGLFNQMSAQLRTNGKPTDAYVWNNPWLKNKVRGWAK